MPGNLETEQIWPMLDGAVIGGMGGLINHLRGKSAKDWWKMLVAVVTAAFSGMLMQLAVSWLHDDVRLQFALAGIAGYSGVTLLDDVSTRVRRLVTGGLDTLEKTLGPKDGKD